MFYQCGVDILDTDKLGRLSVTREGCKQRDRLVLQTAHDCKIPIVASMGGGYSPDFRDIIEAHANTYRLAQQIFF
jgi:acetoin utilization deacetylase AcuC-like enzyme